MLQDFSRFFDAEGAKSGRGPAEGLAGLGLLSFNLKVEISMEILPLEISSIRLLLLFSASPENTLVCFEGERLWCDHLWLSLHPSGEAGAMSLAEQSLCGDAELFLLGLCQCQPIRNVKLELSKSNS